MSDDLGDRMKSYEGNECDRKFLPMLPIYARIDGRSFSKFTKGMNRPFDVLLSNTMIAVTQHLVEQSGALIGYTQSDEISLAWHSETYDSEIFFNRRVFKMTSILAAMASAKFNHIAMYHWSDKVLKTVPVFDCRIYQVPNLDELANCFLWRELDATKNAISMAAQHYYSHKQLHGVNGKVMQEMLHKKGVNFNDYPTAFKRGTFVRREVFQESLTPEQLAKIPASAKHLHNGPVTRSRVVALDMPKFLTVTNRVGVIARGETPDVRTR